MMPQGRVGSSPITHEGNSGISWPTPLTLIQSVAYSYALWQFVAQSVTQIGLGVGLSCDEIQTETHSNMMQHRRLQDCSCSQIDYSLMLAVIQFDVRTQANRCSC